MKGKLIVISGPSGVGKTTIRKRLLNEVPNLWYSISATTRKIRQGETEGVDYYFLTNEEFQKNIKENNFLEYQEVYQNTYYGTLKSTVIEKQNQGINVILEIDVQGALNIKKENPNAILIFIAPPNKEELEKRLISRATDEQDKIIERIKKAHFELEQQNKYDYVIINKDVEEATKQLKQIIEEQTK